MKKLKIAYTVCYVCSGLLFGIGCAVLAWAYCDISWRIAYNALQASPTAVLWYIMAFLPAVAAVAVLGYMLEGRYKEAVAAAKAEEDSSLAPSAKEKIEEPESEEPESAQAEETETETSEE